MQKLLSWLDDHILSLFTGFLLVFIPLFPKLPLLDILPGYIVRVRLEDFFVTATLLVWFIWLIRGKINLADNPLVKPILIYLTIGFVSMISALFVIKTVPLEGIHVQKMILHFLRRVEYFSLFFVFFSSIKSIRQLKIYLAIFILAIIGVSLYGFGQKYLYWPAFSTMNREFSKGWMLYLTEHARVLSTFGGHYDLAAYIMMALVLLWSVFFAIKNYIYKLIVFVAIACAFWTLILTASRTSFIAYMVGLTAMFFFWAFKKGIRWSLSRWVVVSFLSMVVMLSFGDLSERFTKFLRINERIGGLKSFLLSPIGRPPQERAFFLENNPEKALAMITSKSDQPPTPMRPSDVFQDIPLPIGVDSEGRPITFAARTYSKTAFIYDLSSAIRFDALWPMAISGFKRNPILGSGYSTLNKTQFNQFTEAESTDNDYLRSLGETGFLGFIAFFGTLLFIIYLIFKNLAILRDPLIYALAVGLSGLLVGLLVNAVYIDVFEASKVAFSFWSLTGFILAGVVLTRKERKVAVPNPVIADLPDFKSSLISRSKKFFRSDLFFVLAILALAFVLRLYKINTPLADWHSWRQADTSAVTRNFVKHGVNLLYPTYDDLSNVASGKDNPKGLRFVEFPLYNFAAVFVDKIFVGFNLEISQRLTSIFATLGAIVFLFLLIRKYLGRTEAILSAFLFSILPYNIFFTRVILPEPFLVFTSLGMLYFFDLAIEKNLELRTKNLELRDRITFIFSIVISLLFTISAILVKPYAVFLFLPMTYLWIKKIGISVKSIIGLLVYWVIGLLPFIWWRWWMSQFPEGIPANLWLLNGDGIRFKGAFFFWLFADRLGRLISGYWGLPLLFLGILVPLKRFGWFFRWWGVAILLYVTVFATGNVRHDYYQIFTVPIIVIFMAKGINFLWELTRNYLSKFFVFSSLFIVILFMEMFGWYYVRDFYNINHPEIVEAGRVLERKTKDNVLVIAPYNGDTAFLYQTNRAGWPIMQDPIEKMIERGAHYFVSVNFDDLTNQLVRDAINPDEKERKYKLIELTDKYAIIQLVSDNKLPK